MFEAALQNKVINEPDSFKQGIDYTTAITNSQKDKPDYYLTRGFINILARDFSKESLARIVYSNIQMQVGTQGAYPYRDYLSYIRAAIFYTKEEFQEKYSPETYPLVNSRYEIVVNHIKNNYNIDLEGIAKGPQK